VPAAIPPISGGVKPLEGVEIDAEVGGFEIWGDDGPETLTVDERVILGESVL
jgi:hypothetical protein